MTRAAALTLAPGLALAALVAATAFALRLLPGFAIASPMILAVILGIVLRNLFGMPMSTLAGVNFSARQVLRFAVASLGLQLTLAQVAEIGISGIAIIVAVLIANFLFTTWLGRVLDVDQKLAVLIAAGTSICGASAVVSTNTVTRGSDEDVAYAVACVTIFGSLAMFIFPLLANPLALAPHAFGLWAGSAIHEIAQVVAAAFQDGAEAGHIATVAKLSRVVMLAPMVVVLGIAARRTSGGAAEPGEGKRAPLVPWFVSAFLALVLVGSAVPIPSHWMSWIANATAFLLSMALGALGLETDVKKLLAKGVVPFLLGGASAFFIASLSLALIKATGIG